MSFVETLPGHGEHEHGEPPPAPYVDPLDRRAVLRPLGDYTAQAIDWLWRERIPAAELCLLVGDGGLGKSTFLAHIAAEVTSGRIVGRTRTGTVMVVLGEDDPARVLQARYRAAGADMSKVSIFGVSGEMGDEPVSLPDEMDLLVDAVAQNAPELLIVDPLSAHLAGSVDAHRDGGKGGVRGVLGPLSRMAQKYGTTVVCAVHLNKGSGPASSRIAGSAGFRNAPRNVLVLAAHPDAKKNGDDNGLRILGHEKYNLGEQQPPLEITVTGATARDGEGHALVRCDGKLATTSVVTIGEESEVSYEEALRAASDNKGDGGGGDDALGEAIDLCRDELADGPMPSTKLDAAARDAGISTRTLKRARKELGVKSAKGANGWTVSLPGTLGTLHALPVGDGDSGPPAPPKGAKSAKAGTLAPLAPLSDAGFDEDAW